MANVVSMEFHSVGGDFAFLGDEMPLFGRRLEYQRPSDQGYGNARYNCDLNGFFDRSNHEAIIAAYQELLAVIKANDCEFVYSINGVPHLQKQVYMDGFTEPSDWKQFQGEYQLQFHYFEPTTLSLATLGIAATYLTEDGLYSFDQTPLWGISEKPNKPDWRVAAKTPGDVPYSQEVTITLQGRLTANDYPSLKIKVNELRAAFAKNGTLTYGSWVNAVRVGQLQIPDVFPRDYCDYSIQLHYDTSGILDFECRREFSRLHAFPKITEYPFCNRRSIKTFGTSGQYINYYLAVRAETIDAAREFLANEAALVVASGGIEIEGGKENWDEVKNSVSVSFQKFYDTPILANLGGT